MDAPDKISVAFDEFVVAFMGGEGDPDPYLDRFEGEDRRELELLIEAFIETGPRRKLPADAPLDPKVAAMTARVMERIDGATGGLSRLVTELRKKLGLKQSDVVGEIATSLDATDAERQKIEAYYHDLEWGTLPGEGLSETLYEQLARILKTRPGVLREAAAALGPGQASNLGPVFARTAEDVDVVIESNREELASALPDDFRQADPPDRIDELFTGG